MEIKLATAPVSWGVLLKDTPNVPPWMQVLDEMQEAGYTGTELGPYGFMTLDKGRLTKELDQRGLSLVSAYVQINFADPQADPDSYQETVATARFLGEMGCEWLVLSDLLFASEKRSACAGRVRPEDKLEGAAWDAFVENVNSFAKRALEEFGLKSVYHPHVGAWVESKAEVDRLMNDIDPDLVGLCLDTAHCTYGGDDPIDLCRRWGERLGYLHLKECDGDKLAQVRANNWDYFKAVEIGVFPEIGQGSVDFAALLDVLRELDFSGWAVIEQDIVADDPEQDALASARRNLEYLQKAGYQ